MDVYSASYIIVVVTIICDCYVRHILLVRPETIACGADLSFAGIYFFFLAA